MSLKRTTRIPLISATPWILWSFLSISYTSFSTSFSFLLGSGSPFWSMLHSLVIMFTGTCIDPSWAVLVFMIRQASWTQIHWTNVKRKGGSNWHFISCPFSTTFMGKNFLKCFLWLFNIFLTFVSEWSIPSFRKYSNVRSKRRSIRDFLAIWLWWCSLQLTEYTINEMYWMDNKNLFQLNLRLSPTVRLNKGLLLMAPSSVFNRYFKAWSLTLRKTWRSSSKALLMQDIWNNEYDLLDLFKKERKRTYTW